MVASGPRELLIELESRGGVKESSQTLGNPLVNAKRREQRLSALAVYQCVGQFRGQKISSPIRTRTCNKPVNRRFSGLCFGNLKNAFRSVNHGGLSGFCQSRIFRDFYDFYNSKCKKCKGFPALLMAIPIRFRLVGTLGRVNSREPWPMRRSVRH